MVPQSYERLAWNLDVYIAIAAGNSGTKNRILRSESKLTSREAEKYPRKRFESPRDIKFTKEKTVRTSEMVLATPIGYGGPGPTRESSKISENPSSSHTRVLLKA